MGIQVGQILDARVIGVFRHDQGVFGAFQVGPDLLDGAVFQALLDHAGHRRHPQAEEGIDIAVAETDEGDGHAGDRHFGLVAEGFQNHGGDPGGGLNVGPADFGKRDLAASVGHLGLGRGGERAKAQGRNERGFDDLQHLGLL